MRKVYQYGCLPPHLNEDGVRAQIRFAHDYQNDLIAIERGRRAAIRAIYDADEQVSSCVEVLKTATKSTRKAAKQALYAARRKALAGASGELARIAALDESIRKDARAITKAFWGNYLDIEARHQAARTAPLYADDGLTPADPHFRSWRGDKFMAGQVGIQIQATRPMTTADVLRCGDSRVRLAVVERASGPQTERLSRSGHTRQLAPKSPSASATLSLRIGSEGRDPIWAEFQIPTIHRRVPDAANWKWVRVSVRLEALREVWSVEITVDDPAMSARSLDGRLSGAIAVDWCWDAMDSGEIRVANWADTFGEKGDVRLCPRFAEGIRKPDGIRAVRDILANEAKPKIGKALRESKERLPPWLVYAAGSIHLWKSLNRMHELARRWRAEKYDGARDAYELLQAWELRDAHLYDYEAGARGQALRRRRDFYRCLAAEWSRRYRTVLLSDRDLSREAKWGEESAVRTTAGCYELAGALRNAFGDDAQKAKWEKPDADEEKEWCERACAAWQTDGARDERMFPPRKEKVANAWATRKAKKKANAA